MTNVVSLRNINTWVGRIDGMKSDRDLVLGYVIFADGPHTSVPLLGVPADGGTFDEDAAYDQRIIGLGWTHIFHPTDLNTFRIGYFRNTRVSSSVAAEADADLNAQYGILFP